MRNYYLATLLLFLVHLPGVFVFRGEFTDGVLQSVYFDEPLYVTGEGVPPARYVPPLYPALIELFDSLGLEPLQAGRLVSLLAYSGVAMVLAGLGLWLGGRLGGPYSPNGLGWTVWAFWALSPVANRWAFHSMTDMTFCFYSTLSIALFLRTCAASSPATALNLWTLGNLAALCAVWTRYQGYVLAAAAILSIAIVFFRSSRDLGKGEKTGLEGFLNHRNVLVWLLLIAAWAQTYVLQREGRAVHGGQFSERAVYDLEVYWNFALAGLRYFPYALTPPLFLLLVIGVWFSLKRGGLGLVWTLVGLVGGLSGLVLQTWFHSFQFRYGLPLLPWACLMGGLGLWMLPRRYRVPVAFVALVWLAGFSCAILSFQKGTFADIEAASRRIPPYLEGGNRVWAREEYNFLPTGEVKYGNVKVSVWSGVRVEWLDEKSLTDLREGDLIVDPNVTPIPDEFWRRIRTRWKTEALIEEISESIPLTPGEILWVNYPTPQGTRLIRGTSDPNLMRFRYNRQHYATTVYRLESPKTGARDPIPSESEDSPSPGGSVASESG